MCDDVSSQELRMIYEVYTLDGRSSTSFFINDTTCDEAGARLVSVIQLEEVLTNGECTDGSYPGHRLEYCLVNFKIISPDYQETYHDNYLPTTKVTRKEIR